MDPMQIEKIQAMNKYHKNQFLNNFFFYSSIAMTCSLLCFCSSPLWYPSLWSSINAFLFVSLPNIKNLIFTPKCLFIVCNIIVVFLIGESKLVGSKSSPDTELYDEYIKNSKNYQRVPITQVMKKEKEMKLEESVIDEEHVKRVIEEDVKEEEKEILLVDREEVEEQKQEQGQEQGQEQEQEQEQHEEENGLPAEELNKRVEEFIARMKKQRRLEAGLLVSTTICGY